MSQRRRYSVLLLFVYHVPDGGASFGALGVLLFVHGSVALVCLSRRSMVWFGLVWSGLVEQRNTGEFSSHLVGRAVWMAEVVSHIDVGLGS